MARSMSRRCCRLKKTPTPRPVKTIPGHFMPAYNATVEDVNAVFGDEDETHFNVGTPLELETTQVNLDLKRLVERSVGVFGKSGTGKSFLTRVLLAGVINRGQAVNLIFDMHNDYGWDAPDERGPPKGLKQLFPSKVCIITLDAELHDGGIRHLSSRSSWGMTRSTRRTSLTCGRL